MNLMISKPQAGEFAPHYGAYINLVPSDNLIQELETQLEQFSSFMQNLPNNKLNYAYADGKWTIAQLIQHILDTERIYVYRMLHFVRGGQMDIPGFDHDSFAANANAANRSKTDLIEEFNATRRSTIAFLKSITLEQSLIIGKANNFEISVRSLGYTAYGHIAHHVRIISERYL